MNAHCKAHGLAKMGFDTVRAESSKKIELAKEAFDECNTEVVDDPIEWVEEEFVRCDTMVNNNFFFNKEEIIDGLTYSDYEGPAIFNDDLGQ